MVYISSLYDHWIFPFGVLYVSFEDDSLAFMCLDNLLKDNE